ncbi:MAG: ATP-dependent DNA helicase [Acidimicrobiales bacterium]
MPDDPVTDDPTGEDPEAVAHATATLAEVTRRLPAGESRPQQVEMCAAVARAVDDGRHLVVQAGTGTGKSLAYLVPAALSGRRVVVATATKALQDQLAGNDLPLVDGALGEPFTFAVLKGRSNYLCRQRAVELADRGFQQSLDDAGDAGDAEGRDGPAGGAGDRSVEGAGDGDPEDPGRLVDQVRHLLGWAEETQTGDRADLAFEPHPRAWAMLSVGPRECPGAFRCPSGSRCFAEAARARAAAADVVVVNTHLYGAHLASDGAVLPDHDVVVFDEAHELEEVMTSSLGVELSPGRLRALVALARPVLDVEGSRGALDALSDVAASLSAELAERVGTRVLFEPGPGGDGGGGGGRPEGRERHRGDPGDPGGPGRRRGAAPDAAERQGRDGRLAEVLELATARVQALTSLLHKDDAPTLLGEGDGSGRRARVLSAAGHLSADLGRLGGRGDDEVAWVDGTRRAPVLRLSPVDVGPPLAATLWGEVTAVLTSATVPLRLPERLGLRGFALTELDVGSPFDYRDHSMLYVARHLPDRRTAEAEPAIHAELEALIRAAGGRTLALFTSHRATEAAAAALGPVLPYRVLVQGELPKGRLLRTFADDESSCLFATLGFWQGVDVPGRSLTLVTLDRLPFARPDDPLLEARRERAGDAAFRLVDLPRAATLLAQGAGRLIRSAEDRGVVAVLDPRLATAGYRGALLAGMPPMRRTTDRRQVEDFLARILASPAQ